MNNSITKAFLSFNDNMRAQIDIRNQNTVRYYYSLEKNKFKSKFVSWMSKIHIYILFRLLVLNYGCETWSLIKNYEYKNNYERKNFEKIFNKGT